MGGMAAAVEAGGGGSTMVNQWEEEEREDGSRVAIFLRRVTCFEGRQDRTSGRAKKI
jgi:hypothetical protein